MVDDFYDVVSVNSNEFDASVKNEKFDFLKIRPKKNCNFDLYSSKNYTEIYKKSMGKFRIRNGKEISYEPYKNIKLPNLAAYLFSNVFAYLLYQRGHVVLHASAIEIDQKAYFFSGRSGIGKSSLLNNLLSTGNHLTEVNLSSDPTTLIVGSNGAGKSTILDALTFSLYGKSFRKINKAQLINSTNEKDCFVSIEFSINGVDWKVERGIKPNIFKIYKNVRRSSI